MVQQGTGFFKKKSRNLLSDKRKAIWHACLASCESQCLQYNPVLSPYHLLFTPLYTLSINFNNKFKFKFITNQTFITII